MGRAEDSQGNEDVREPSHMSVGSTLIAMIMVVPMIIFELRA